MKDELEDLRNFLLDCHDSRRSVLRLPRRDLRNAKADLADMLIIRVSKDCRDIRLRKRPPTRRGK
jgi:hypothetical protein